MAKKATPAFQMTKIVTKVDLAVDPALSPSGDGPYKTDDLHKQGKNIEVFGTQLYEWADGSSVACFIIPNDDWVLSPRAMRNFRVVDWKEE